MVSLRTGSKRSGNTVDVGLLEILQLTVVGQTVVTHILMLTCLLTVVESVDNQLLRGNSTPNRELHIGIGSVGRQTILEEFPTITENILGDITKVEIDLTALMLRIVDEGIHHPELDVLIVGGLEIRLVELTHDTAPTGFRIFQ